MKYPLETGQKIIGIGNAIVDLPCLVEDNFLNQKNLTKSSMSLIDETSSQQFLKLKAEKISCGGSTANTIATIAALGGNCNFFGKVGDDELGQKFVQDLENCGATFVGNSVSQGKTANSFILITPDGSRTMCTFLGCASQISEEDFHKEMFADAGILYIEGYLWDNPHTILALRKAIDFAKASGTKIALTLSDSFCVQRHKADFLELALEQVDILLANETEILELFGLSDFSCEKLQNFFSTNSTLTTAITRSEKGCVVFCNQQVISLPAFSIKNLVDTTGAGDSFAAGFLMGLSSGCDLTTSAKYGNFLASKIIQKIGARFNEKEMVTIKNNSYVD